MPVSAGRDTSAFSFYLVIAELVINFAFTLFGFSSYNSSPRLFERMIQGMLEYEVRSVNSFHFIYLIVPQAAYTRLIYSADRPSSCNRTVTGPLSYEVLGWFVTTANIGLLFPMTIINLAGFIVLLKAIITAKGGGYLFSPFCPRPVEYPKTIDQEGLVPDEWMHKSHVPTQDGVLFLFRCSDCLIGGSRF